MAILSINPKLIAENLADESMPAPKIYECLLKGIHDSITLTVLGYQMPDGNIIMSDDDIEDYVEAVIALLEDSCEEMWTDDQTYFEVLDAMKTSGTYLTGIIKD